MKIKYYSWDSVFDFGQFKGQTIKEVFDKNPSYISWCFQKVDLFCISDEIFNQLPIIVSLKNDNRIDNVKNQKDWLKICNDLHISKKEKLLIRQNTNSIDNISGDYSNNFDG